MGNSPKKNNTEKSQNLKEEKIQVDNLKENDLEKEKIEKEKLEREKLEREKLEKEELENEKNKILKGTYEDRYKITENKDPLDFYDKIIGIDSFLKEPEIIWTIQEKPEKEKNDDMNVEKDKEMDNKKENEKTEEDKEIDNKKENKKIEKEEIDNKKENEKIEEEKKENNIVIGILGLGNVGKSYLLSLFTEEELPSGDSIHTKGISVKILDKIIILDSEGVEAPLTEINISKDIYSKEDLQSKGINDIDFIIQKIAQDKKAIELFIQDFIMEKSNILFIVVGQLTLTEQKLINRVINETDQEMIFVIHNLKNLYSIKQINNYIETIFKKNIFMNNISEQKYENTYKKNEFNTYFTESYNINDKTKKVVHLIMASNVKNSEAYYFNKTVVEFVRRLINTFNGGESFDIIKELKNFILTKSRKYIECKDNTNKSPILEEDIKIEKEGNVQYIKIKNKIRLKKCLINQLGFSSFYGALYSPNYICYIEEGEKGKKFIIDINLCGTNRFTINKPKREDVKDNGNKTLISITGNKKLKEYKIEGKEGGNMDFGDFRIDIIIDNNKYKLSNEPVKKDKMKGNIRFTYTLLNDDKNNLEMRQLTFEKPKKKNEEK